ncbi:MAG TPA: hypothetical protein VIP11_25105 [Gemmatimonadaceae bacterium]
MTSANSSRGRPGGPGNLSDAQRKALFDALRLPGVSYRTACRRANIEPHTLQRWLERGRRTRRAADAQYVRFVSEFVKVCAEAEAAALALIAKAAQDRTVTTTKTGPKGTEVTVTQVRGDWRAIAWILERRYPKKYGRRDHHTHAGDADAPIVFELDTGGNPALRKRRHDGSDDVHDDVHDE